MKSLKFILLAVFCISIVDPGVCMHLCEGMHDHNDHGVCAEAATCCDSNSYHHDIGDPDHTQHCHSCNPGTVPLGGHDHQRRDLNPPHSLRTEIDPPVDLSPVIIWDADNGGPAGGSLFCQAPVTDPTMDSLRCVVMIA